MENDNLTPAPEQPEQPVQQPVQQPAQPQYRPPYQAPQYPQYPPYPPYAPQPPKKKTPLWKILVPILAGVLVIALALGVYFLFFADAPAERPNEPTAAPQTDATDIVGTWRFDGAYVGDEYYYEADATLYVYDNSTARLILGGETTMLTWKFAESTDRDDRYTVRASDGTVCAFWLVTDPKDEDYGVLLLYGNQENIIYFVR